jgi:acid phosphatase
MRIALASVVSLLVASTSFAQDALWKSMQCSPGNTIISATLWVQNSAEYKANTRQVYANATRALDEAIKDKTWSALGQTGAERMPLAVILDLDETALSNAKFEARSIRVGVTYSQAIWDEWTSKPEGTAIPGAKDFLTYAKSKNVTPFYVTNRKYRLNDQKRAVEAEQTVANLNNLGFPVVALTDAGSMSDNLLLRFERDDWADGDKTSRRDWVAQRYRVLLLVGDDLNDFVSTARKTEADRDAIIETTAPNWGTRWFILPNPMYGSWNNALFKAPPQDGCEEVKLKIEATRP